MLSVAPVAEDDFFAAPVDAPLVIGSPSAPAAFEWEVGVGYAARNSYSTQITDGEQLISGGSFAVGGTSGPAQTLVSGPGSNWVVGQWIDIGDRNDGRVVVENGGFWDALNWSEIGTRDDGNGEVVVRGAGSRWDLANHLTIGSDGGSTTFAGGRGRVIVEDGGVVNVGNWAELGDGGPGEVFVRGDGSQFNVGGRLTVAYDTASSVYVTDGASLTATSLDVRSAGAIFGDGILRSNITNAGRIGPGSAHGILRVEGSLQLAAASNLEFVVAGTHRGENYGAIDVTGPITYGGKLTVTFAGGFAPRAGDEFELIRGNSGTFAAVEIRGLAAGFGYSLLQTGSGLVLRANNDAFADSPPAVEGVLANDHDVDGDALRVRLVRQPTDGTLALSENGAFSYQPRAGFRGLDTFAYRAFDGTKMSDPVTVTIQVGAAGAVASDDEYQIDEDGSFTASAATGVMANDHNPLGTTLAALRTASAVHGNVALNPDGSFTYTAPADFSGVDSFQYRLSGGGALSNIATVRIVVGEVNDPPVVVGELYHTREETPLVVSTASSGDRIFESTSNPPIGGGGGSSISPDQFLGARFEVTSSTTTGRVGGMLGGTGTAFAALVALTGPDDLPDSFDMSASDVLGHTILTLPGGSGVLVSAALEMRLSPGWYAIVIGTGVLGADGNGYMPSSWQGEYEIFNSTKMWTDGSWRWNSQPDRSNHFFVDAIGTPANLLANDSDAEHAPLTAAMDTPPHNGAVAISPNGDFTYTPNAGFVGTDTFTYRASDGESMSDPATVTIVVQSGITPLAAPDVYSVDEDASLVVDAAAGLLANDSGRDAVAQLVIAPERGELALAADGSFAYTPDANYSGVDRFWYRLQTADSASAPTMVTIEIAEVTDVPVASDDVYRFEKDTVLRAGFGQIAAEHLYIAAAQKLQSAKLDGSELRTVLVPSTSPHAVAVDAANGWFYWSLGPADFKIYRSRFDGSEVQTLATIAPVPGGGQNPTPYVTDIALDVAGGKMYWATSGPNDTSGKIWRANLDGTLPAQLVSTSAWPAGLDLDLLHGKVYWTNSRDGTIQRANLDGTGLETVLASLDSPSALALDVADAAIYWFEGDSYRDNRLMRADLNGEDVESLLEIPHSYPADLAFDPISKRLYWADGTGAIWAANRDGTGAQPILDGGVSGASGLALDQAFGSGYANHPLANDMYDLPAGAAVSVQLVQGPTHGALTLNADGTFVYEPELGFQGNDSFRYRLVAGEATSNEATSNEATVTLSIIRQHDIPAVAVGDSYSLVEDTTLVAAVSVLANDTDAENDPLVASLVNTTVHGTLVFSESGAFTYTPDADFFGQETFEYRVWDGYKFSNFATVTIAVEPVPDAPIAAADRYYAAAGTTLRIASAVEGVLANDRDGDGDAMTAVLLSEPAHGSVALNADGTFSYTPDAGYLGADAFTYRADDATFASSSARVDIEVQVPRTIGGYVWHDADANGRQTSGELPAAGVVVRLLDTDATVLSSALTDASGRYTLGGLAVEHDYYVEIAPPEETVLTRKDAGADDAVDSDVDRATGRSDAIRLTLGEFDRQIDAGLADAAAVADVYDNLRISELLFIGHGHAEFIELTNVGTSALDLSGVRFTDGVYFDFAVSQATVLLPGEYVVIVGDLATFRANYPSDDITVAGQFTGRLNQEERLTMVGPADDAILDFVYDDDWFAITDDEFSPFSISALDLHADPSAWNSRTNWRPSSFPGGTPGFDDPKYTPDPGTIVISEFLANPLSGERDWIELHNTTNEDFDVGNWWLGDGRGYDALRYRIPAGTVIPADGYVVFHRNDSFTFGLAADGDSVYLTAGDDAGHAIGYSEMAEDFVATAAGTSLGRIVLSDGGVEYSPLAAPTPGSVNAMPLIGPLVINEVMYRPADLGDEFIEIYNVSQQPVALDRWSIETLIEDPHGGDTPATLFSFPAGAVIPSGGYALVVSIDPAAFRAKYGIAASVPVVAPFADVLSDDSQLLRLLHIDDNDDAAVVDQVRYAHSGAWPVGASMGGRSLERIAPPEYANEPTHWQASMAIGGTPGASNTTVTPPPPGDFNGDFTVDTRDIDLITMYLSNPTFTQPPGTGTTTPGTLQPPTMFDVTSDGTFTTADVTHLITTILHTSFGDADLNGRVGLADLMTVQRHFGQTAAMGWADGDFTGDGRVDQADLAVVVANLGHATDSPQAPSAAIVAAASAIVARATGQRTPQSVRALDRVHTDLTTEGSQRTISSTSTPRDAARRSARIDVAAITDSLAASHVRSLRRPSRRS